MKVRLTEVRLRPTGKKVRLDRDIEVESLFVGRGPDNDLSLKGLTNEFYKEQLMHITRTEFVRICVYALQGKSVDAIQTAAATFVAAQKLRRRATAQRMKRYAAILDFHCRRLLLPAYFICLLGVHMGFDAVVL